jgi:hemerythrin-like domain-containing protein
MLEKILGSFPAVIQMLRDDHQSVRSLFSKYKKAEGKEKATVTKAVLQALVVHMQLEEQVIYPAFRDAFRDSKDIIDEGVEEHHLAHVLLRELTALKPAHPRFDAKFTVLQELIKHHVDEEEAEMFPKAEAQDINWDALSRKAHAAKAKLLSKQSKGRRSAPHARAA